MQTNPLARAFDAPVHQATIASGLGTSFISVISWFSPSEWMVLGIIVGILSTIIGLIVSVYIKFRSLSLYKKHLISRDPTDPNSQSEARS